MSDQAAIQELRRASAIACAWLTPGNHTPRHIEGIPIPEVDMDLRDVVSLLHTALRDTERQIG